MLEIANKYMKTIIKLLKKDWFWLLIILPIVITTLFWLAVFKGHAYYERQLATSFEDGVEVGRYLQLNEDAENTQAEIKAKKEASKTDLLKKLAHLESQGGKRRKVLDTNGKYSLGQFHFQAVTVKDLYRRYYKKDISVSEAVNIANDDVLSTQLAHDAIFVHKEYSHWKISMCKLGMITKGCLTQKQINNLYAIK